MSDRPKAGEAGSLHGAGSRMQILLPGGVPMFFRLIPAGDFRMGRRGAIADEEPVHWVKIAQNFWLGETPVTQKQFALWTTAEGIEHANGFFGKDDYPAENMDWHQANAFCEWLTRRCVSGFPEGFVVAGLPYEAEWEYACRADTDTEYHTGDGAAALAEAGWFSGNSGDSTQPVGRKAPSAWGLRDMHGNVWEWCGDVYDERGYRKRPNGWAAAVWTLPSAGNDARYGTDDDRRVGSPNRVLRGGSWLCGAGRCRSAGRDWSGPSGRNWDYGFRVCLARSSPAQAQQTSRREAEPAPGGVARRETERRSRTVLA